MKILLISLFFLWMHPTFSREISDRGQVSIDASSAVSAETFIRDLMQKGDVKGKVITNEDAGGKVCTTLSWTPCNAARPSSSLPINTHTQGNALTYSFSHGRLGDHIISYLHAKWLSYKYNLPLHYVPFDGSEDFAMDDLESQSNHKKNRSVKKILKESDLFLNNNALFVIPYIPENKFEYEKKKRLYPFYIDVDWEDPQFRAQIAAALKLKTPIQVDLPKDKITIGVHVRRGGGFDPPATLKKMPLKFPSDAYYIEQLKRLSVIFAGYQLSVHIVTDDNRPHYIASTYEKAVNNPLMTFHYRDPSINYRSCVLEDFYLLQKFDCLIFCDSNFSFVASKLSNYMITIKPTHASLVRSAWTIDQVELLFYYNKLQNAKL